MEISVTELYCFRSSDSLPAWPSADLADETNPMRDQSPTGAQQELWNNPARTAAGLMMDVRAPGAKPCRAGVGVQTKPSPLSAQEPLQVPMISGLARAGCPLDDSRDVLHPTGLATTGLTSVNPTYR